MRNPTAMAFQPETGQLWALVQERDGLGDNLPNDYLTRVQQGGFYGWPYAYIGKHPQPGFANLAPDKVGASITPDLLFQSHSSLLDLVFYEGDQFPVEYKGSLFVAVKGSWNRSAPTGYATGFWASGESRAEVWDRPAALAIAKDGSLLVGDVWAGRFGAFPTLASARRAGARLRTAVARRQRARGNTGLCRQLSGLALSDREIHTNSSRMKCGATIHLDESPLVCPIDTCHP